MNIKDIDLDIFEKSSGGGPRFKFPCIHVSGGKTPLLYLNTLVRPLIEESMLWTMAKDRKTDQLFVCFLPRLTTIKGYKISVHKTGKHIQVTTAASLIRKFDIPTGSYFKIETDESIFKNYILWYPLTKVLLDDQ